MLVLRREAAAGRRGLARGSTARRARDARQVHARTAAEAGARGRLPDPAIVGLARCHRCRTCAWCAASHLLIGLAAGAGARRIRRLPARHAQPAAAGSMAEQARRITGTNLETRWRSAQRRRGTGVLAASFNELLSRLDQSFDTMRRFVADASHELRTPISVIRGEADVALSQERSAAEYRESLAIVLDESRRLSRLVDDLLNLARADAGHVKLQTAGVLPERSADGMLPLAYRAWRPRAASTLECRARRRPAFPGDEELLRRLVMNLLDNAIRYTPAGGKVTASLEAAAASVMLGFRYRNRHRPGGVAARVRTLLPRRRGPLPPGRRLRPRPRDREVDRRIAQWGRWRSRAIRAKEVRFHRAAPSRAIHRTFMSLHVNSKSPVRSLMLILGLGFLRGATAQARPINRSGSVSRMPWSARGPTARTALRQHRRAHRPRGPRAGQSRAAAYRELLQPVHLHAAQRHGHRRLRGQRRPPRLQQPGHVHADLYAPENAPITRSRHRRPKRSRAPKSMSPRAAWSLSWCRTTTRWWRPRAISPTRNKACGSRSSLSTSRASRSRRRSGPLRCGQGADPARPAAARRAGGAAGRDKARIGFAVFLFPDFRQDFTVVDDLDSVRRCPPSPKSKPWRATSNPGHPRRRGRHHAGNFGIKSARAGLLPTLSVDYFFGLQASQYALHNEFGQNNLGSSVVATLNVPVWNWGATRSKVKQAELPSAAGAHRSELDAAPTARQPEFVLPGGQRRFQPAGVAQALARSLRGKPEAHATALPGGRSHASSKWWTRRPRCSARATPTTTAWCAIAWRWPRCRL